MKKMYRLSILLCASFVQLSAVTKNISVLGIGRLGICSALCFERAGYKVLGLDVFPSYVQQINDKTLTSPEPKVNEYLRESKNLKATTSLDEALAFSDVFFIVVPTPTGAYEAYDHSILSKLLTEINKRKVQNKHVVICCTVFPGYIRNVARFLLKDCTNTTISYNPEFIAQGNIIYGFENPDMVLVGEGSKEIGDILEDVYHRLCKSKPKICRMSPESAEITKLSLNCFVTTKIAFANMIGDVADSTPGANKFDILNAVGGDSRVGSKYFKPGYGFGGPCFPRDNRALGTYAAQVGIEPLVPRATDNANKLHAQFMAEQMLQAHSKTNMDEYHFYDVNYKDNCNVVIIEESQKLAVAETIARQGKKVIIHDRPAVIAEVQQKYGTLFQYEVI